MTTKYYLFELIEQEPNHLIVLVGDFNAHLETPFGALFSRWLDSMILFQMIKELTQVQF